MGGITGKENLKVHLYKSHGIGEMFRCEECNFESSTKSQYIKHLSLHAFDGQAKLTCVKCSKSFKSRNGYLLHLKQHLDDRVMKVS